MTETKDKQGPPAGCTCNPDPYSDLPQELRPKKAKSSSLRQVTCPGCGLVYRTNRETDLCMECERKRP